MNTIGKLRKVNNESYEKYQPSSSRLIFNFLLIHFKYDFGGDISMVLSQKLAPPVSYGFKDINNYRG